MKERPIDEETEICDLGFEHVGIKRVRERKQKLREKREGEILTCGDK